jgi:lysophospholipase
MTSPMLQMRFGRMIASTAGSLIDLMCLAGRGTDYAFGQGRIPYVFHGFEGNVLTSSEEEYLAYRALIEADPDLGLGGPTFGWLRAGLRSIAITRSPAYAQRIGCPVILAQATEERVVGNAAIARLAELLPHGELLTLADARHEILIERPSVRKAFWAGFDAWFSRLPG